MKETSAPSRCLTCRDEAAVYPFALRLEVQEEGKRGWRRRGGEGGGGRGGVLRILDGFGSRVGNERTFAFSVVGSEGDEFVPGAVSTLVRCGAVRFGAVWYGAVRRGLVGVEQAFLSATPW